METLQSGGAAESARVENVLNMFINGDLGDPRADPRRMRVLPLMCRTVLRLLEEARQRRDQLYRMKEQRDLLEQRLEFMEQAWTETIRNPLDE